MSENSAAWRKNAPTVGSKRPGLAEKATRTAAAAAFGLSGAAATLEIVKPGTLAELAAMAGVHGGEPSVEGKEVIDLSKKIYGEYTGILTINIDKSRLRTDTVVSEAIGYPSNILKPDKMGDVVLTPDVKTVKVHAPLVAKGGPLSGNPESYWAVIPVEAGGVETFLFASLAETEDWMEKDPHGRIMPLAKGPKGEFLVPLTGHGVVSVPKK